MRAHGKGRSGFAIAIVLLVAAVALAAAVSSASVAALSARRVVSNEGRASAALFAAESGLNTLLARGLSEQYAFDGHPSIAAWLADEAIGLGVIELPNGATVRLTAHDETATRVTIRAVGTASDGSSQRAILQDFDLRTVERPRVGPGAGLVTKTPLKTNARGSVLAGIGADESAWVFATTLAKARVGEYLRFGGDLHRVLAIESDGSATLQPLATDALPLEPLPGDTQVELIPFALADPGGWPVGPPETIRVTNPEAFPVGTAIEVGGTGAAGSGNRGVVTAWDIAAGTLSVAWETANVAVTEGLPVRRRVLSAIAEGGCPSSEQPHYDSKLPQGCEEMELDDLWATTFGGLSKTQLRDVARGDFDRNDPLFADWLDLEVAYASDGAWPTAVEGLTWIDGAQTRGRNNALCGTGIVVLNTGATLDDDPASRLNLTTQGCSFAGLLYVIGQVKLVGNLDDLAGAIYVEGPDGVTESQGNGAKVTYDPLAVREALDLLPPIRVTEGLLAARPGTWRFSQR